MAEGFVRNGTGISLQRQYYKATAVEYDDMHLNFADQHFFALRMMLGIIDQYRIESALDIGSGTGRALLFLRENRPCIKLVGVEPSASLRSVAHSKGVPEQEMIDGDATALLFADGEFDLVCAFGVLHHIANPDDAVAEMLRVARVAIFISDSNNFGQGTLIKRSLKQLADGLFLWPIINFLRTGGKRYMVSHEDGVFYSYSITRHREILEKACERVTVFNTENFAGWNMYRSAGHMAILGLKRNATTAAVTDLKQAV